MFGEVMSYESVIPNLPYQAAIVGIVADMSVSRPPTWIEVVYEIQRWG